MAPRSANPTAELTYLHSYAAVWGRLQLALLVGAHNRRCDLNALGTASTGEGGGLLSLSLLCPGAQHVCLAKMQTPFTIYRLRPFASTFSKREHTQHTHTFLSLLSV